MPENNIVLPADPGMMTDEEFEIAAERLEKLLKDVPQVTFEQYQAVRELVGQKH
jgi:hypothetical protein